MRKNKIEKRLKVNGEITASQVHLIMDDGRSAGVVSLDQARYLAEQNELDLVELNGNVNPPIVKLLDYNKYRYQQEKNARSTVKPKSNDLKEIRLSFSIDEHDLSVKAKRAKEFLDAGHFVRAYIQLRGRENVFPDKAKQRLFQFQEMVDGELEQPVTHVGKRVQIIIKNKK
ncbi:translation initiation factor IF-3 [Candidatus Berkelbacteria bacterium]|nr:translation initiation factor IF-3 [Candidatus Berkelbacteria bacterium]